MAEQPEHEQLRHVGLASASDGKDADVFDEILPRKVERIERFARIDDGTKQHLAGRLLGGGRWQQDGLVVHAGAEVLRRQHLDQRLGFALGLRRFGHGKGQPKHVSARSEDRLQFFAEGFELFIQHGRGKWLWL